MTSRRWSTFVSGLVLTLALASGGSARAQWGFPGNSGPFGLGSGIGSASGFSPYDYGSFGGQFGLGSGVGSASGFSPFNYGSFGGGLGYGGFGGIGFSPLPGYAQATGQVPQTTASYQSAYDVVTSVPGWSRSTHRVRRRH
jgi:hypothetical protein